MSPVYEKYGTKPPAVSVSGVAAPRMAQPMREPSYAWMIIARPATSADEPPVVTAKPKADTPSAFDVYAIDVHGSAVTEPV